ncbi:MAG: tRNA adenosine(34) deaminase TadA [Desulfobacterales bacterium]|nr:MAG: tRNA adenosine(34) deaminase TadA [Desulfobacterales bacterium]
MTRGGAAGGNAADEKWMRRALELARRSRDAGEVPVGALITDVRGELVAEGRNRVIAAGDPSAHAEMDAIRRAAEYMGNYRLLNTTLYVTMEPCIMCMGAVIHARIERVVFGAFDTSWGAAGSLYDFSDDVRFNHRVLIRSGLMAAESRELVRAFFQVRRRHGPAMHHDRGR